MRPIWSRSKVQFLEVIVDAVRKLPIVVKRIEIQDGPYAGWWAEMRTNPPMRVMDEMRTSQDPEKVLASLIIEWNFVDEEGTPLTPAQIGEIPPDLYKALYRRYTDEVWNPFWLK